MKNVQAMFYLEAVTHRATQQPTDTNAQIKMAAAFGSYLKGLPEGNGDWSKYTPQGDINMTVTNPFAVEQFEPGAVYRVTFEKVSG